MKLFMLGVTVTVLTACAVGPNFKPAQSPASDRYTASDLPPSFASGANVPYEWWKVYRCPPLDALVESALQSSPTVKAAQAALRQANELVKAQRAVLFPTLQASYSPTRERNAVGTLAPTLSSAQPLFTLQTAQVSVSYVLDVFGGNRRQIESAQALADSQRYDLEAAYLTLTSNVVAAAIQEASLRAQIEANEAIVRSERDGLDILNKQLTLGSIAQTAVMAQQAALAAAEAQLPPLRKQLAIQRDLLAVLAGRSPGEPPSQTFELAALTLPSNLPISLPSALVRQRPDVLSAEEQLHYASAQVGVAIADLLPQINLLATYGGASTSLSTLLASSNTFWSAGASLTQTLFAGGALWHHKLAADAALDEAAAEYRTVVLTALQNVADTLNALQFDAEAVAANERADQAARASLVASRASLTQGSITYLDLLNAEQAQALAISNLEQARGSRLADTAALFAALGGGWWSRPTLPRSDQSSYWAASITRVTCRRSALLCLLLTAVAHAQTGAQNGCPRPAAGSVVPEPRDLRSHDGVLRVELTIRSEPAANGSMHYCYLLADGSQSPTLRLHPGDLLDLHLVNALTEPPAQPGAAPHVMQMDIDLGHVATDPCTRGMMSAVSTNLHFHGLTVPARCHQDEVLRTSIQPSDPPFEYKFRIPQREPPGLYWYHPHIHGFSSQQVLGGASGAMIIEGLERAVPEVAGLPERVLVIRDQELLNPDAPPSRTEPVVPRNLIDRDGDAANNGTGFGKPAKDLSVNFVPVPYPDYPPATIRLRPLERQLWRVVNASAVTYLNLAVLFQRSPQPLGLVAIDGVPMNWRGDAAAAITSVDHIGVPPGARVEFVLQGPPQGVPGLLVTRTVDTGQGGENDPNRALARLLADPDALEPQATLPAPSTPLPARPQPWLGDVEPVRVRKLYFSEKLENPQDPNSATTFYITVDGKTPTAFDPANSTPDITVQQGDVEDWIIENRTNELHAFHIHQLHFALLAWNGVPVNEPFLRDTVNVPYFSDRMLQYPTVRVRMDFRDPDTVGTFVYHCHLLEHEDAGMMGVIRVEPRNAAGAVH